MNPVELGSRGCDRNDWFNLKRRGANNRGALVHLLKITVNPADSLGKIRSEVCQFWAKVRLVSW